MLVFGTTVGAYTLTSVRARYLRISFAVGSNVPGPKSAIHGWVTAT